MQTIVLSVKTKTGWRYIAAEVRSNINRYDTVQLPHPWKAGVDIATVVQRAVHLSKEADKQADVLHMSITEPPLVFDGTPTELQEALSDRWGSDIALLEIQNEHTDE